MPKPVAISKFLPALRIPPSDQTLLRKLATTLVTHDLEQYNSLSISKDGHPDARVWKPTRKAEGLRIYRERPGSARKASPEIPSLLLLGSVTGTLDDIMYAAVALTDESLKIKSSCIRDGVVDSKVLGELVCPTADDPFHHVSLQWRLYEHCDYVTLDTAGTMLTPWGERVGYSVSHSVGFPQLPAFTELGITRGNMSVCSLFHQKANNTVECYTRGFFDMSTHGNAVLALEAIATQWLSLSRNMQCAHMKKLAWYLRQNNFNMDMALVTPVSTLPLPCKSKRTTPTCRVCAKSFSFLPGRKKFCNSCDHAVCSRCYVKTRVFVLAPDLSSIHQNKRAVCSHCIHKVVQSDAAAIARDELLRMGSSSWRADVMCRELGMGV
uniref:FYVE-type domain-containing protein n=1 Tax=Peronospora matthiolae TaxID=2874970 RepID=A0AAV1USD0_9STRA